MSVFSGPNNITNGLIFHVSASNLNSYPGTGTTWYDLSGNNNHGTLTNMSVPSCYVKTYGGKALSFDGVDDGVLTLLPIDVFINNTSSYTISLWHKPASISTTCDLVAQHQVTGAAIGRINANVRLRNGGQTLTSAISLAAGNWYHIVGTLQRSATNTTSIYINSIKDANTGTSGTVTSTAGLYIGRNSSGQYADGQIDDICIYNRALTAQEILQNYNATRGRFGL